MSRAMEPGSRPRSVIVVSTGRTGTKAIAAWTNRNLPAVASWHEPFPSRFLRPLCHMRVAGQLTDDGLIGIMRAASYARRRRASGDTLFFEASPYLRACVDLLPSIFEDPLVLHLVRDPRAYVTSYINHGAFSGPKGILGQLVPYWQLKPEHIDPDGALRWRAMPHHERICWRWNALNRLIEEGATSLPGDRYLRLRCEDIIDSRMHGLAPLAAALGIAPGTGECRMTLDVRTNESRNALHPAAYHWSEQMISVMHQYCGERMRQYGYD